MKSKTPLLPLTTTVLLAVLASGCATADPSATTTARIQEKAEAFAQLAPDQQENIRAGIVDRGYTADMVYMVLGPPAKVKTKDSSFGKLEMWTYLEFTKASGAPQVKPAEVSATGHTMGPLNDPGVKVGKLFLYFAHGKVVEIKYDSEGS